MPETKSNVEELDLHWKDAEPDLEIASEGVNCKNVDDIAKRIEEVKSTVKIINLHNQHSLTSIPSILKECELLEELNISHTEITAIPMFVFSLPNLRSLSCCCRKLSASPAGIENAKKLERLHIRINEGWSVPEEISALSELKTFIIDNYSNAAFPKSLGELKKIENLTITIKYENGTIQDLPASFTKHPSLKNVEICDNIFKNHKEFDLEKNAKLLASCPALFSLKLSGFTVKKHHNLSLLSGLKTLEMRHLLVEGNIFDSIKTLQKLEKLDILGSDFKINELPDIFGNFKDLQSFSFAGNFIRNIPHSIYNLVKLTTLEIGSTGITSLAEDIGNLKELEKLQIYDNLLEKLPEAVFKLPRLAVLNIEENIFRQQEIESIKQKLGAKNVEFFYERQGNRRFVKILRALKDAEEMEQITYCKHCFAAINENPRALKYVNNKKLGDRYYAEMCMLAVKKTSYALKDIDPQALSQSYYYLICMEAVKKSERTHILKSIRDDLLTETEYILVCLEAAIHNTNADFLECVNHKHMSREAYERICWVAALRLPSTISRKINRDNEDSEVF